MVKMAVGAGTDANANPGLKRRAGPGPVTGVAPAMLAAPTLSGPGLVGAALRVDPGVWGGVPAPAVTLRWRRDGVDVPGASAPDYVPAAADDGMELRGVVTASNASGSASAVTEPVRITHAAPVVAGALADRVLDQGQGAVTLDASAAFTGAALVFGAAGAGATIDPATGLLSIPDDTPRAGETVTVTATNSGGSASVSFTVTVIAAPVLTAPASLVAPSLVGSGRVGAPMRVETGTWSGDPTPVLSARWTRNGADISGADAVDYVPVPADDGTDLRGVVTAMNAAGTAEAATAPVRIVHAAPVVAGALADRVLDQGQGAVTLDASAAFTGAALVFGAAGAGATIDPATGLLSIPDDTPRAGETVTVTATNSGGSASVSFTVTVTEVVDTAAPVLVAGVFDAAASPATLSFSADEGGTAFWLVDGATTRGAAEVEAGGGAISGDFAVGAGATARDVDLGTLSPGVWNMHLMVRDAAGNRSNVTSSVFDFAPSDLTAPVLSGIAVKAGQKEATLSVSTDEAGGTLYWMVDTAATRSAEEIHAGGGAADGSRAVDAAGPQASVTATGLTSATGYRFHAMHENAAGNRSAAVSTGFVTASPVTGGGIRMESSAVTVSSSGTPAYAGAQFVVGDAANRGLVAMVHGYSTNPGTVPGDVAISFGGVPMVEALAPTTDADLNHREWVAAYVLAGPVSGPGTLALDWTLSTRACAVTLVELSGVDQATPIVANGVVESGGAAGLAFTRPAATEGSLLLSALCINSGGRSADIGVTGGATELRKGETGPLSSSDVSFAVAAQPVIAGGPKGHGYALTPAERAILGWLEMKEV